MRIVYDLVLFIYSQAIRMAAIFGNQKAKNWIEGRIQWQEKLRRAINNTERKKYWFHCASLGEFEQGRPLIEKIRSEFPDAFLVLTFFSPSGFEIRKNYPEVNYVCYLPIDTKSNATIFVEILNPDKTFFIKYEFWYHFFQELKKKKKETYIISANFRPDQVFFKWYGGFFRSILQNVTHLFVQDKNSSRLLTDIGINATTVSGDTRFDRVIKITSEINSNLILSNFKKDELLLIAGSTWKEDEELILQEFYSKGHKRYKLIIFPHEIHDQHLKSLEEIIDNLGGNKDCVRYSNYNPSIDYKILLMDTIGMLSSAYYFADITYVGGGFGKGIHNILEPAAHGKPILFGPGYNKFREAHELIAARGAFSIKNQSEYKRKLNQLLGNPEEIKIAGLLSKEYVITNSGACEIIYRSIFS